MLLFFKTKFDKNWQFSNQKITIKYSAHLRISLMSNEARHYLKLRSEPRGIFAHFCCWQTKVGRGSGRSARFNYTWKGKPKQHKWNMIPLEKFLQDYNIKKAKNLEHKDPQFLALQNCRNNIKDKDENLFLYLVIQCSIVSYQIAWSGELWRTEFGEKVQKDWNILLNTRNNNESNTERRFNFLKTSKNNKRIYNIKKSRIDK